MFLFLFLFLFSSRMERTIQNQNTSPTVDEILEHLAGNGKDLSGKYTQRYFFLSIFDFFFVYSFLFSPFPISFFSFSFCLTLLLPLSPLSPYNFIKRILLWCALANASDAVEIVAISFILPFVQVLSFSLSLFFFLLLC